MNLFDGLMQTNGEKTIVSAHARFLARPLVSPENLQNVTDVSDFDYLPPPMKTTTHKPQNEWQHINCSQVYVIRTDDRNLHQKVCKQSGWSLTSVNWQKIFIFWKSWYKSAFPTTRRRTLNCFSGIPTTPKFFSSVSTRTELSIETLSRKFPPVLVPERVCYENLQKRCHCKRFRLHTTTVGNRHPQTTEWVTTTYRLFTSVGMWSEPTIETFTRKFVSVLTDHWHHFVIEYLKLHPIS